MLRIIKRATTLRVAMPGESIPPDLYPLTELPHREWMPRKKGKPINRFTALRWALHGRSGHRLQTLMVGGIRCCCDVWAMAFFEALTGGEGVAVKPHSDIQRRNDYRDAEDELSAAGIG